LAECQRPAVAAAVSGAEVGAGRRAAVAEGRDVVGGEWVAGSAGLAADPADVLLVKDLEAESLVGGGVAALGGCASAALVAAWAVAAAAGGLAAGEAGFG